MTTLTLIGDAVGGELVIDIPPFEVHHLVGDKMVSRTIADVILAAWRDRERESDVIRQTFEREREDGTTDLILALVMEGEITLDYWLGSSRFNLETLPLDLDFVTINIPV